MGAEHENRNAQKRGKNKKTSQVSAPVQLAADATLPGAAGFPSHATAGAREAVPSAARHLRVSADRCRAPGCVKSGLTQSYPALLLPTLILLHVTGDFQAMSSVTREAPL